MGIPVYLFTGLLESGKTTLIYEVAGEEGFLEPGTTLLLRCEDGETPYDQDFLQQHEMILLDVDAPQQLCKDFWQRCEDEYAPAQIMVEYNGMWEMKTLFDSGMPEDWFIGGIYSTVNGAAAQMYLTNMRKIFMEPLRNSNLIIFNRCSEDTDRRKYRRIFKGLNPQVQVVFERENGILYENEMDAPPYDYSGSIVEIKDMDYGLWYLDAMENPQRYMGKEIRFTARYCKSAEDNLDLFIPGRHVMTCCEDDIEFLGFLCRFEKEPSFGHGDWVSVAAEFDYGPCDLYGSGEEGPLLHLVSIREGSQPEQELVIFA